MKDGTSVYGLYLGTIMTPAQSAQDNYVFLPAAGYFVSGAISGISTDGFYLNQVPTMISGDSGYVGISRSGLSLFYGLYTGEACSLRCVRDK